MIPARIAVTIDRELLAELDRLVEEKRFTSRSGAVQEAIREKVARARRSRLAAECAKLDPKAEQVMADEGLAADVAEWPEY